MIQFHLQRFLNANVFKYFQIRWVNWLSHHTLIIFIIKLNWWFLILAVEASRRLQFLKRSPLLLYIILNYILVLLKWLLENLVDLRIHIEFVKRIFMCRWRLLYSFFRLHCYILVIFLCDFVKIKYWILKCVLFSIF